jgi:thioesterase domain-containing protein
MRCQLEDAVQVVFLGIVDTRCAPKRSVEQILRVNRAKKNPLALRLAGLNPIQEELEETRSL